MNTYDFDSKTYFILKLKDEFLSTFHCYNSDVFLGYYDDDFELTNIHGAMIFNEYFLSRFEFGYYKLEYFEKIPLILLDTKKIKGYKKEDK